MRNTSWMMEKKILINTQLIYHIENSRLKDIWRPYKEEKTKFMAFHRTSSKVQIVNK